MPVKPKTILVVGDIMLDVLIEGDVERISPEAPVPVVRQKLYTATLGGAGNVARNVRSLGCQAILMGVTGADTEGAFVESLCKSYGIMAVIDTCDQPTLVKQRVTSDGQMLCRIDKDGPLELHPDRVQYAFKAIEEFVPEIAAVIVADYAKGTMTPEFIKATMSFCGTYGIPLLVDTKPENLRHYTAAYLIKPNLREAMEMVKDSVHPGLAITNDIETICDTVCMELAREMHGASVVVTSGEHGCSYVNMLDTPPAVKRSCVIDAEEQKHVRDICGAGDTTIAALAVHLANGHSFDEAVQFAMFAASYAVQFYGTHAPSDEEVYEFMHKRGGAENKIMNCPQLTAYVARQRQLKEAGTTVLAFVAEDGITPEAVEAFRYASKRGDTLIVVGMADDATASAFFPEGCEVPETYRLRHLAELDFVDAVAVSHDTTLMDVVKCVCPDVFVVPACVQGWSNPAVDFVAAHQGVVEYLPDPVIERRINQESADACGHAGSDGDE